MNEKPEEHFPDDLDIEIIDLDVREPSTDKVRVTKSECSPLVPRFTRRQRQAQVALTTVVMLSALLILLVSYAPTRGTIESVLLPPAVSPTPAPVVKPTLFYFEVSPGWGTLFIDGKRVQHIPTLGYDAPLRLASGRHAVQWVAEPFRTQRCTISIPVRDGKDDCHVSPTIVRAPLRRQLQQLPVGQHAWLVDLTESLTQLAPEQRSALLLKTQAVLDQQTPVDLVRPGERYALANGRMAVASQPLQAKLNFQLDTNTVWGAGCRGFGIDSPFACLYKEQDCHLFCSVPWLFSPTAASAKSTWSVLVVVASSWSYRASNGELIVGDQPDSIGVASGYEHVAPLSISWDGEQWSVAMPLSQLWGVYAQTLNPLCASAEDEVQVSSKLHDAPIGSMSADWHYFASMTPAAGCLAVMVPNPDMSKISTVATPQVAFCLHRFGVFFAANASAHRLWPSMPVANAYEQSLVQQLLKAMYNNDDPLDDSSLSMPG